MRRIALLSLVLPFLVLFACTSRDRSRGTGPLDPLPGTDGGVVVMDGDGGTTTDCGELTACGESCVSLASDVNNCGECGVFCGPEGVCEGGECVGAPPSCPEPRVMCGESCVDLSANPAHCGFCDNFCESGFCGDGVCTSTCTPSCTGRVCGDDGCGGSCGTCGSGTACTEGTCTLVCGGGTTNCSGRCVSMLSDTSNCGACGNACLAGQTCSSGTCTTPTPTPGGGETCTSATDIPGTGGARTFTFSGRVANHTPFSCGATSARPDVTFRWTAARTGSVMVRVYDSAATVDTMLSVFSSSSCTSTYEVICNDDEPGGTLNSEATFSATAGTTYYFVAAPYSTTTPTGTITLSVTPS